MEKYNRLKVVLTEKGIKQKDFAVTIGINKNTIASICNNRQQPSLKTIKKMAIALGVTTHDLIEP